jgi:PBP1b-binding outer membrane lipoprotein LpoB
MKKILSAAVLCLLIFTGCSAETEPVHIELEELKTHLESVIDFTDIIQYDASIIQNYYGIDSTADVSQILIFAEGVTSEGLYLIEAASEEKSDEIIEKLEKFRQNKLNELSNYTINPNNAEQYVIVEKAEIITEGSYIFWAVYENSGEINIKIENYIKELRKKSK